MSLEQAEISDYVDMIHAERKAIDVRTARHWFSEEIYRGVRKDDLLKMGLSHKRIRHAIEKGWLIEKYVPKDGSHFAVLVSKLNPAPARLKPYQCFLQRLGMVFDTLVVKIHNLFAKELR